VKNPITRINLLSNAELDELYSIPIFNEKDREIFFALSPNDWQLLDKCRTQKLKVYFVLQLVYFRATKQFYDFKFEDTQTDTLYVLNRYFDQPKYILSNKPYRETIRDQQRTILKLYNYVKSSFFIFPWNEFFG
jgi:hypothetical protein